MEGAEAGDGRHRVAQPFVSLVSRGVRTEIAQRGQLLGGI